MTAGLCACAPAPTARIFCAISGPRTGEQVDVPRTVCHARRAGLRLRAGPMVTLGASFP